MPPLEPVEEERSKFLGSRRECRRPFNSPHLHPLRRSHTALFPEIDKTAASGRLNQWCRSDDRDERAQSTSRRLADPTGYNGFGQHNSVLRAGLQAGSRGPDPRHHTRMTSEYERLFTENLELIDGVITAICRRHCCSPQDAEDFASTAKLKLIDNDYAVLRKFQGKSTLKTYLTTVLHNLFRDFRIHEWGRWRPSAKAKRHGPEIVQLETLLHRDGYSRDEAIEILKTNFGAETDRERLAELAAELPARVQRRPEGEDAVQKAKVVADAEATVIDLEREETAQQLGEQLTEALDDLTPQERLILKMRYRDSFSIAQIAQILNLKPRPLYKTFERCQAKLRRELEGRGVSSQDVVELVGWDRLDLKLDFDGAGRGNP